MVRNVRITTEGIRYALNKLRYSQANFYKSIAEYIWNGFDAKAKTIVIEYDYQAGLLRDLKIKDDGYGINQDELSFKFDPFFESEKLIDGRVDRHSSTFHGRNGVGRLTFCTFSNRAKWITVYEKNGKNWIYEININANKLEQYSGLESKPKETEEAVGTIVTFDGIKNAIHNLFNEKEFFIYLKREFCWFLELHKKRDFKIIINGTKLDYISIKGDYKELKIEHKKSNNTFEIRYLRWNEKTNDEFSKFYYLDENNGEKYKENTLLNNQGDDFFHSVYISSGYFKNFNFKIEEGSKQTSLSGLTKSDDAYKYLMEKIYQYLRRKRKPFLKEHSIKLIKSFEDERVIEVDEKSEFDTFHKEELKEVVKGLYETQPKIFSNLNLEQKKTLIGFISLILDSDERERILEIIEKIVELDSQEREELRKLLRCTHLSRIVRTINMIKDRYVVLRQLKEVLFNKALNANEINHLQKIVEVNTWIFGEKYSLVAAAEDDFEKALREHIKILEDKDEEINLDHPNKRKQVDIFICRQRQREKSVHNIIIELKHPQKILNEGHLSQVKKYMRTILEIPRFNADSYTWDFLLIGTKYDKYIEGELKSNKSKGEEGLVSEIDNYKIYVRKWSDVLNDCEIRHKFIDDKLKIQKDKITKKPCDAEEAVKIASNTSAKDKPR